METTKMLETNFVIVSLETDVSLLSITSLQSFKCDREGDVISHLVQAQSVGGAVVQLLPGN